MLSMKNDKEYREQVRLKAKNDQNIDLTEEQIDMCIFTEEEEKLSYFHGHIYINPRNMKVDGRWITRVQWAKTIDGYRVLARRNGLCRVDEPAWQYDKDGDLFACRVSIWRRGPDGYPEGPFVGVAHYHEYAQLTDEKDERGKKTGKKVPNRQWLTSPMNQLAVCAERQAHRKAGLDHTHVHDDIVDIEPRGTVDEVDEEVIEQKHREAHEESRAEEAEATAELAPTLSYQKAHRGHKHRGAMIVGTVSGPGWHAILMDNGKKVVFGREGDVLTQQEIADRDDKDPGGSEWADGSDYYDGSKVMAVVTKGRSAVLTLDSGFKVKLDQWGKEVGRKPVEAPEPEKPAPTPEVGQAAPQESSEFTDAMMWAEDCSGATMEQLRKAMFPLLAYWCKNFNNGVKLSPKMAYIELVGVAIGEGDKMRIEDYKALLETLYDKISKK